MTDPPRDLLSVPSCLTLEAHLVFIFPYFPPSSPYCKYADCAYIEGSVRVTLQSEVTTCILSPSQFFVGGRQLCGNSSRLRYSDLNPRGQSRACFGNKFYVIIGTPIGHTVCGCFSHSRGRNRVAGTSQGCLLWASAQRLLTLTIDSFLRLHRGPGVDGPVPFHLSSWLLPAASSYSLKVVAEVA